MLAEIALSLLAAGAPPPGKPAASKVAKPADLDASVGVPEGAAVDRASQPVFVIAEGKGGARVLLDGRTAPGLKEAALTELVMLPGASVAEHVHDTSAEILYVLEGHATMVLGDKTVPVRAGMAIWIPAGTKHSFKVDTQVEPLRAIQVYTPGGPEQRFLKGAPSKE